MFLYSFLVFKFTLVFALEAPILSKNLQPRNFNPHPYDGLDLEFNNLDNTGPVEFPKNSDEFQLMSDDVDFISVKGNRDRFSKIEQEVLSPVYGSLSEHARKVLNSNQLQTEQGNHYEDYYNNNNGIEDDYVEDSNEKIKTAASNNKQKKYKFSYAVKDGLTGDDFSHTQRRNENGAVHGSYKVQLPDGRVQIVRYIADDNGYRADVVYENNGIVTNNINSNKNNIEKSHSGYKRPSKLSSRYHELPITPRPKYSSKHQNSNAFNINPRVDSRVPYESFLNHQPISYYQKSSIAPNVDSVRSPVFFMATPHSRYNPSYQNIINQHPLQNYYFHNPSSTSLPFVEEDY